MNATCLGNILIQKCAWLAHCRVNTAVGWVAVSETVEGSTVTIIIAWKYTYYMYSYVLFLVRIRMEGRSFLRNLSKFFFSKLSWRIMACWFLFCFALRRHFYNHSHFQRPFLVAPKFQIFCALFVWNIVIRAVLELVLLFCNSQKKWNEWDFKDRIYGGGLSDFCECGLYPFWFKGNNFFKNQRVKGLGPVRVVKEYLKL